MRYQVHLRDVVARPTAVIPAATTWQEFPTLWMHLLDEVWACLRAGGVTRGCRNVMLYWDDLPHIEVGVELLVPCPLTGQVIASALPMGQVATTVHYGAYKELAAAHQAVIDWCTVQKRQTTGTRWEIYGPNNDDPAKVWTEVYYLLK
ncbi:MAG: GyrI-like domain-containing protein [Ktedonobacterales bacterium]|nr:GyrI-like domain-containing protein [Ktedonobacterales bacterium]